MTDEKALEALQDIDPIEFLEDYLGIKLLVYQKEILRRMLSTNKIDIYPWQSYERPNIRVIDERKSNEY